MSDTIYISTTQREAMPTVAAAFDAFGKLLSSQQQRSDDAAHYASIVRGLLAILGAPTVAVSKDYRGYENIAFKHPDERVVKMFTYGCWRNRAEELGLLLPQADGSPA